MRLEGILSIYFPAKTQFSRQNAFVHLFSLQDAPTWVRSPTLRCLLFCTGVPRSQETARNEDPAVGLCQRPYGGSRGWAFSYVRGTPARPRLASVLRS